jgi:hypothetical protein
MKKERGVKAQSRRLQTANSRLAASAPSAQRARLRMKYPPFFLLLIQAATLHAQTFQEIVGKFPIGTSKEDILKKEPTAIVGPAMVHPLHTFTKNESIVMIDRANSSALVVQFQVVDGKLAAATLLRPVLPGVAANKDMDLEFVRGKKILATFTALRMDRELNPLEVTVEKRAFGEPDIVALVVKGGTETELRIIDEKVFDPKAFFMEATEANRLKVSKSKLDVQRQMEAQKKLKEELEKEK